MSFLSCKSQYRARTGADPWSLSQYEGHHFLKFFFAWFSRKYYCCVSLDETFCASDCTRVVSRVLILYMEKIMPSNLSTRWNPNKYNKLRRSFILLPNLVNFIFAKDKPSSKEQFYWRKLWYTIPRPLSNRLKSESTIMETHKKSQNSVWIKF